MSNILWGNLMPFSGFLVASLVLSATTRLYGQDKTFDERYDEVYHSVFASGPQGALAVADSLNAFAEGDEQRMKSRMLLGTIHHGLGNTSEALFQVMKAQEIAEKGKHKDWEARTTGFLANIYRLIGLSEEAKKGYEKAEELNESQKAEPSYYLTKANILQEKAHIAMYEGDYVLALTFLEEAENYISQNKHNVERAKVVRAINEQIQAICYLYLDDTEVAEEMFQRAKATLGNRNSMIIPYVYRGKAEMAIKHQQYDSAYHYLGLIEPFVSSSQDLEVLFYNTYASYYKGRGKHEQAIRYMAQEQEVAGLRQANADRIIDELVQKLEQDTRSYRRRTSMIWRVLVGIACLLGMGMVWLWTKRRSDRAKYLAVIERVESGLVLPVSDGHQDHEQKPVEVNNKSPLISKETETRLLAKLEDLEVHNFFLDKDMSLGGLATGLATNQRYVSYMIRKYRETDFNAYLQQKRIQYIIKRVQSEPELLDYKLSYLADLAGFPNQSKFSAVFKSVTGITPTVFIHYTKEDIHRSKYLKTT